MVRPIGLAVNLAFSYNTVTPAHKSGNVLAQSTEMGDAHGIRGANKVSIDNVLEATRRGYVREYYRP